MIVKGMTGNWILDLFWRQNQIPGGSTVVSKRKGGVDEKFNVNGQANKDYSEADWKYNTGTMEYDSALKKE